MSDDATEILLDDVGGCQKELYLFMFQPMAVFLAQTRQRRMVGWLVNNEMERSATTWNFLKAVKNTMKNLRA
jgi:hypothetical protein